MATIIQLMTADELRQKYLEFFRQKGHAVIPSVSLIPENDPTVLFTTAGMHPLVPYLMGEKHPLGKRLVSCQKCVRTGDILEVGDDVHLTFFEMLGNWGLGDYWKKEAIEWSFEFLTKELGLSMEKLAVSCFAGDDDAPRDEESAEIWKSVGISEKRICFLGKKDNWWDPAGATGPCGPDTEMFYWSGRGGAPKNFDLQDNHWVEIWNDVFMEYHKTANGRYESLAQKNVDTGMGLERTVAILNGYDNVYEIDIFKPLIDKVIELAGAAENQKDEFYQSNKKAVRIIVDHLRAATFILGDPNGVTPSNIGRGYILRRLIRRAIRYAKMAGISAKKEVMTSLVKVTIEVYQDIYPELKNNENKILFELKLEEERFEKTVEFGLKKFNEMARDGRKISGQEAFILFSTYGFPWEMTRELAREKGIEVDEKQFQDEFKKHQELSRTAAAGMFKGGLADAGEQTTKYHTATHLLLAALREVLGPEIYQKGSNITTERLRFDFNYSQKLSELEIERISELVNQKIKEGIPVEMLEMSKEKALKLTKSSFGVEKYGEVVKVYKIGNFSVEICGGPHVKNTGELENFKIIKEEASSAGVRRIKAVLK